MHRAAQSALAALTLAACAAPAPDPDPRLAELDTTLQTEQAHLATFDDLDYNVFSGQQWDGFSRSHAPNITVHWPDGRTTEGLDVHVEDLKAMFVYAPDTRIKEHPIKIAMGEYTAVMGIMEGTFTAPMPVAGGAPIPPTGQAFRLSMATIGRWVDGVMVEEWLFWDNHAFMQQMGLVP